MRRFFVIEADTNYNTVWVHEVTQTFTDTVNYHREASADSVINDFLGPKFYGKLDALLITAEKLKNAPPIVVVTPEGTGDERT